MENRKVAFFLRSEGRRLSPSGSENRTLTARYRLLLYNTKLFRLTNIHHLKAIFMRKDNVKICTILEVSKLFRFFAFQKIKLVKSTEIYK